LPKDRCFRAVIARPLSVEIKTGLEFWFTPTSRKQVARPYKQFLVTLPVIYPLTIIVPLLLKPGIEPIPYLRSPFLSQLIIDTMIAGLIAYVIMPRFVRLLARWLYR
jgi:uncharacterized protein